MAADSLFEKLVKKAEIDSSLTEEIVVRLTAEEMANLMRKAEVARLSKEELLRQYLLTTTVFDMSYFTPKKAKSKKAES